MNIEGDQVITEKPRFDSIEQAEEFLIENDIRANCVDYLACYLKGGE